MRLLIFFLIISSLALSSCYYDSEEELYSGSACDTTNVTYSGTIQPILAANCNSCHTGSTGQGGVSLSTYDELMVHVNSGIFRKAVNHEPGATPMPYNMAKLPDCELLKINAWINNGAPNN